jgi:hypothetical protein
MAAARALGVYLAAGGRLGPEADRWFRLEVRSLPLDRAHTPWLAAVAPMHLGPWLAARRATELREKEAAIKEARAARERSHQPTDAEIAAMRARLRGRGS